MDRRAQVVLRSLLWIALGGWIGSIGLFSLVVARKAFLTLPSRELAGDLVGAVLGPLQLYGAAAGVLLAVLAALLGRGRLLVWLPLLLAGVCLLSHFGLSVRLAELRQGGLGPGAGAAVRGEFSRLHGLSMLLLAGTGLATLLLAVLHVRRDLDPAHGIGPPPAGQDPGGGPVPDPPGTPDAEKPGKNS